MQPNLLSVEEALGDVTFPISKRDLLEQVGDGTALLDGRNVSLHDLIKDLHDDFFESEAEFLDLLESQHAALGEDAGETEGGVLPTGPQESWRSRAGPGDAASASTFVEPPE